MFKSPSQKIDFLYHIVIHKNRNEKGTTRTTLGKMQPENSPFISYCPWHEQTRCFHCSKPNNKHSLESSAIYDRLVKRWKSGRIKNEKLIEKWKNKRDFNFSHLCLVEWVENLFVLLREKWEDRKYSRYKFTFMPLQQNI